MQTQELIAAARALGVQGDDRQVLSAIAGSATLQERVSSLLSKADPMPEPAQSFFGNNTPPPPPPPRKNTAMIVMGSVALLLVIGLVVVLATRKKG